MSYTEDLLRRKIQQYDATLTATANLRMARVRQLADEITEGWKPGDTILVCHRGSAVTVEDPRFGAVTGDTERYVTLGSGYAQRSFSVLTYTFENTNLPTNTEEN